MPKNPRLAMHIWDDLISTCYLEALRKLPNDPAIDKTVLRQAQHEREKPNEYKARPVRPELVEG